MDGRKCVYISWAIGGGAVAKNIMDSVDDIFDADLRFNKVAIGTEVLAALALVFAGESGHHDDADGGGFWGGAQDV